MVNHRQQLWNETGHDVLILPAEKRRLNGILRYVKRRHPAISSKMGSSGKCLETSMGIWNIFPAQKNQSAHGENDDR